MKFITVLTVKKKPSTSLSDLARYAGDVNNSTVLVNIFCAIIINIPVNYSR